MLPIWYDTFYKMFNACIKILNIILHDIKTEEKKKNKEN